MCIAGGLCKQWLAEKGVDIRAHIYSIAGIYDRPFDPISPEMVPEEFPVLSEAAWASMQEHILAARSAGDSVGGVIECAVTGLPAGLGAPMFGGMESRLASILYAIPAVKGLEFGDGFALASMTGSRANDPFAMANGRVVTTTNHAGGILGGITDGMPLPFRLCVKPTPSIALPQQTVSLKTGETVTLNVKGRHDPCIVPRAVPVVEAAAALAIFDAFLD